MQDAISPDDRNDCMLLIVITRQTYMFKIKLSRDTIARQTWILGQAAREHYGQVAREQAPFDFNYRIKDRLIY
ncbi:hypothetical protein [Leeuwenhoekiella sp.]|uniref:hypothetical protein n=1 Tax=Leeuwenhoekiella sp. TaxID=1977054 RepID=UPI0032425B1D